MHQLIQKLRETGQKTLIHEGIVYWVYRNKVFCKAVNQTITHINILDGVDVIPPEAFRGCPVVYGINIPPSVKRIGIDAFFQVGSYMDVGKVVIPSGITEIPRRAFGMSGITAIELPNSVHKIGSLAFMGSRLHQVAIPSSCVSIGLSAFASCHHLTHLQIDNGVKTIGIGAFMDSAVLQRVKIPSSCTTIKMYAFARCHMLNTVEIENGLRSLGGGAFGGCTSLTQISLPRSLQRMDDLVFLGCENLQSVSVPSSMTKLPKHTFDGCGGRLSVQRY